MSTAAVANASTSDVRQHTEAAKQAARALEKAKANADKSADVLDKATKHTATAADELTAAEEALEAAATWLEEARADSAEHSNLVVVARTATKSLERDEGFIDVAAEVANVATGQSDNTVLDTATSTIKAGLTGVLGPVLGLLDPLRDAVQEHIDEAERAYDRAELRERAVGIERTEAVSRHREASIAVTEAENALRVARSTLKKAMQAEKDAAEQHKDDAKAAESAKKKAEKAEAAEKKAKERAKDKAQEAAKAQRGSERSAAAATESRSATVSGKANPGTGGITSRYGTRTHPITGVRKLHSGTDFGYGDGNAYAAASGTVAEVTYDGAYGNMVTLSHGRGVQTRYAHLARASVSVGQQVSPGTVVGKIGSTGMSTGPHLHFEVLVGGDFVNPESWLAG